MRAFAERGISRATHADVARLAEVSPATAFSYFRTRADLTRAVLERVAQYYEEMADRFHQPQHLPARALLEHAVAFATSVQSDPAYARVILEWSTAIRDDTWPLFLRLQERILRRCMDTIRRGQDDGSIGADVDPETAALMIVGSSWMVIQLSFTHWPAERVQRFVLGQVRGAIGEETVERALA